MKSNLSTRCAAWFPAVLLTLAVGLAGSFSLGADVTPGYDFNVDAGLDTDGNNRWEDTVTVDPSGLEFLLDTTNGVSRATGVSVLPGISAAYDFPGGYTGNNAGALLVATGTSTDRSFQNAPGDWTNDSATFELWFKPADLTTGGTAEVLFEDAGGTGFSLSLNNDVLQLRKTPGSPPQKTATIAPGMAGEFIQAVGTFDASTNPDQMQLFVNGAKIGGTATDGNGGDWSGGDPAALGTRGGANVGGFGGGQQGVESFDGQIAVFRVYHNQILTASEVAENYRALAGEEVFFDNDSGDGAWETGANWTTNTLPSAALDTFINDGSAVSLASGDQAARVLTIGADDDTGDGATDGKLTMIGGALTAERIIVALNNGAKGEFHFTDGEINVNESLSGSLQAVMIGGVTDGAAAEGVFVMGDGSTDPTLTISGGRLEVGGGNGATAEFTLNSGTVDVNGQNIVIGQGNNASTTTVTINDGTFDTSESLNLNNGKITFDVNGGLVKCQELRYTTRDNAGEGSTLTINGGQMQVGNVMQDRGGTSTLNIVDGRMEFLNTGATTRREVEHFSMSGGTILLRMADPVAGPSPIDALIGADFGDGFGDDGAGQVEIEIEDLDQTATETNWTGGTGNWVNGSDAEWDAGSPEQSIAAGTAFDIVTSTGAIANPGGLAAPSPDWSVNVKNANTLEIVAENPIGVSPIAAVIDAAGETITRSSDTRVARSVGADAANLTLEAGTLDMTGTDLSIGGTTEGDVYINDGAVQVANVLFGNGGPKGGELFLNGGSLDVAGHIVEGQLGAPDSSVDPAQLHIDGGTLTVGGDITVQRFAVADGDNTTGTYTIDDGQTVRSTGTTAVGIGDNAQGELTVPTGATLLSGNARLGENAGAQATLTVDGGSWTDNGYGYVGINGQAEIAVTGGGSFVSGGDLNLGQNSGGHGALVIEDGTFTAANLTMGRVDDSSASFTLGTADGSTNPTATVNGQIETAYHGSGQMTLYSGTLNMTNNNFITGQAVDSESTVIVGGGDGTVTLNLDGGDGNRDWNTNDGHGIVDVLDNGTINVGRRLQMGRNTDADSGLELTIDGGAVNIGTQVEGGSIDYRNDGPKDMIALKDGLLNLNGGDVNFHDATADQFSFTGGTLQNVGIFGNSLTQTDDDADSLFRIGASPGHTTIEGDYTLSDDPGNSFTAALEIGIGPPGATAGEDFDLLTVTGDVLLDGHVAAFVESGFQPEMYSIYQVIEAANIELGQNFSITGAFLAAVVGNPGAQFLELTYVPEPSALLLMVLGILGLGLRRRR